MNKNPALTLNLEFPKRKDTSLVEQIQPGSYEDVESRGQFKQTVVVLFGWTGAQDKQLAKYSEIYAKMGCITLRCIVPGMELFTRDRLPQLAAQLVNYLTENNLQSHPMFFHVFSTGGALFYSMTLKEIAGRENPQEFDLRGTMFDSAPVWPTFKVCYSAVLKVLNSYISFTFGLANVIAFVFVFLAMAPVFWALVRSAWHRVTVGTIQRPGPVNQKVETFPVSDFVTRIWKVRNHAFLFLYSEVDVITDFRQLEEIAVILSDRGNYVQMVKFEGSGHVLHYRKFPQDYISAVTEFLEGTLESYNGPAIYWDEYN